MTTTGQKTISSFKDLRVWQEAIELVKEIYTLCESLPKTEVYGLVGQMKRAAVSVPSNIAEGHSRNHRAEYRQAIYISIGSLAELETQLHISVTIGFLAHEQVSSVLTRIHRLRGMLLTLGGRLS